jgi:hypothetical protein
MSFRAIMAFGAVTTVALFVTPVALPAKSHAFTASYTGSGTGQASGTSASGSATATGRGKIIGPSTLRGSASGVFTSQTCVAFNGKAVLKGKPGSIKLAVRDAHACAGTDPNKVSFSGTAKVTGGTATFAGARGTLTFSGTYSRQSNKVTISFRGRITYS